ncbi:MAG: type II 3-dehydroquinate dehydratase [Kiritimatiellae bacterium]|nr:type II 3-dehydroquinate dehydratase [Kiritimatiellia bacterium]
MKLLLLNGPNLRLLGTREPDIYGSFTLADAENLAKETALRLGATLDAFQSDIEGELVSAIGQARGVYDGIVINPAAYTHTSVALRDAIAASELPVVELHISNTHKREAFRHVSYTAPVCIAQLQGFGLNGYALAVEGLVAHLNAKQ